MIRDVMTSKGKPAITSDHWHVVHSRFLDAALSRPFSRAINSEHDSRDECLLAARALRTKVAAPGVPKQEQDEVFVRPPNYKSLKIAKRHLRKTK